MPKTGFAARYYPKHLGLFSTHRLRLTEEDDKKDGIEGSYGDYGVLQRCPPLRFTCRQLLQGRAMA